MGPKLKLNIGSGKPRGEYRSDEWINIDVHQISGVMQLDVFEMPHAWTDLYDEVRAVHCLEHVNRNRRQEFVDACFRVTKPGGVCYIEVPNFQAVIADLHLAFENDDRDLEHRMTTGIFGKQRYDGDQHCWGFTSRTLFELCDYPGWDVMIRNNDQHGNADGMISTHYRQEPILLARCEKKKR